MKPQILGTVALGALLISADGLLAQTYVTNVAVGAQSPAPVPAGGAASYAVTLNRSGSGRLDAYMSVAGLPAGVSASFSPNPIQFTGGASTAASTLTLSTTAAIANGTYPFQVQSRDGQSPNTCAGSGTLVIASSPLIVPERPSIVSISLRPDKTTETVVSGTPGGTYKLEATADLAAPSWTAISTNVAGPDRLFTVIDPDAVNHPARFYRAAAAN